MRNQRKKYPKIPKSTMSNFPESSLQNISHKKNPPVLRHNSKNVFT